MRALAVEGVKGGASLKWQLLARFMEIVPGLTAWLFLLSPLILSLIEPLWVAFLIIGYDLIWLSKNFGNASRLLRGYTRMRRITRVHWRARLADLKRPADAAAHISQRLKQPGLSRAKKRELRAYRRSLQSLVTSELPILKPSHIYHALIVATLDESIEVLEPTVEAIAKSDFPLKRVWLYIAYEARGGPATEANARALIKKYGRRFGHAEAIKHPDKLPGEAVAKAGNITYAGRALSARVKSQRLDPEQFVVTTLDADNRPHAQYLPHLTFIYATTPDRTRRSYQPLPMFLNNIWDVPAAMRVVASWNSFWVVAEAIRPHRLRNFSAHAQSLKTLIDTDFWNVRSIVEDGHQFWRTYYRYNGDHQTIPVYTPIYQDAVLTRGYWRTYRAQFKQLRRWAWGSSDISFVFINNLRHREIPWAAKWWYFFRLYEGFFTWATAPIILAGAAWLPLFLNADFANQAIAHQLPVIASYIQTLAMVGAIAAMFVSLVTLPPRPARYRAHKHAAMIFQWLLLPFVAIGIHALAALNALTRLMFGKYLETFEVTEKATVSSEQSRRTKQ